MTEKDYAFFDSAFDRYAMPPVATHNYLVQPLPALALLSPDIIPAREPSVVSGLTKLLIDFGALLLIPAAACGIAEVVRRPQ